MVETIKSLVDQGKFVIFYLTPKIAAEKGKYTAEIEYHDEDFYVFADSFEQLLYKLERKEFSDQNRNWIPEQPEKLI